jgi:hypothetical protein
LEFVFAALWIILLLGLLFSLEDLVWEILFARAQRNGKGKEASPSFNEQLSIAIVSTERKANVDDSRKALLQHPDSSFFLFLRHGDSVQLGASQHLPQAPFVQLRILPDRESPWWTLEEQWERERESSLRTYLGLEPLSEDRAYLVERTLLEQSSEKNVPPASAWTCLEKLGATISENPQTIWVQTSTLNLAETIKRRVEIMEGEKIRRVIKGRSGFLFQWLQWRRYRQLLTYRTQQISLALLVLAVLIGEPQDQLRIPAELLLLSTANSLFLFRKFTLRSLAHKQLNPFSLFPRHWATQWSQWRAIGVALANSKSESTQA